MATVTATTFKRQADPTPAEIEIRKAEIDQRRLEAFDAKLDSSRENARLRMRARRAAAKKAAKEARRLEEANGLLQQQNPPEPIDPATARNDSARRNRIQFFWDARREHRALAADADARGVLNYYNINRGPRMPYYDRENDEQFDMMDRDIANVELLEFGEVDKALGMMIDAAEAQHEMEELNCRWGLGGVEPPAAPTRPEVPPFKSASAWPSRDIVAFRSKRRK